MLTIFGVRGRFVPCILNFYFCEELPLRRQQIPGTHERQGPSDDYEELPMTWQQKVVSNLRKSHQHSVHLILTTIIRQKIHSADLKETLLFSVSVP